ncbi:transposase [Leptolyngbya sp. PL-A3]|nr:transposase [Leptolyngbya sp. FACHB-16]
MGYADATHPPVQQGFQEFRQSISPKGTSQTCPQCGVHTGKKELSERMHHGDACGYVTDRDVAAAQVVEQRGLILVADGQSVVLPVEEGCMGTPMK